MSFQNCSAQQRRILNLIWASAGEYDFDPLFMAYGTDRKPDYYMNCIVGFVHKWYGEKIPRALFESWAGDTRQSAMDDLTWLALENAAYERELPHRPALRELRREHASKFFSQEYLLSRQEWMAKNQTVYAMQAARWKSVLGQRLPILSPREKELFAALSCPGSLSAEELAEAVRKMLRDFMGFDGRIRDGSYVRKALTKKLSPLVNRLIPKKMVRSDDLKITRSQSGSDSSDALPITFARGIFRSSSRDKAEADRQYIENCFGRSLFPRTELERMEQDLCTGRHFGCHLWFSDTSTFGSGSVLASRRLTEQAALQEARNRKYYSDNIALHENTVRQLTEQIHNSVLVHQQSEDERSGKGRLDGSIVWRQAVLEDGKVFVRRSEDPQPGFTVDLLLDGSASRLRSQEIIAAQGYILSESLTRCKIPVRVSSFCSVRSYTVLRILKDYSDLRGGKKIFQYFASGWNRDGLALRGMGQLLRSVPGKRHLLILLTDASPSDSRRIPPTADFPVSREYDGRAGIDDTAEEVRALRQAGIRVAAVFMGVNSSVPAAQLMFGRGLVRIQRIDQMASAAGKLIQSELQELSN